MSSPVRALTSPLAKKLGVIAVLCVLLVLVLELVLRARGYATVPSLYHDPEIGNRYYPNQDGHMVSVGEVVATLRTNSLGYRGPTFPREKRPGVTRIACLGDSYTFGIGVSEGATYPEVLAELLGAERVVEVLNFGFAGYNTENELRCYLHLARDYAPDVVVLGHTLDDVAPMAAGVPHSDALPFRLLGRTALLDAFNRHLRWRIGVFETRETDEEREFRLAYEAKILAVQLQPDSKLARPYWQRSMKAMHELCAAVEADGGRMLVVLFPAAHQIHALRKAKAAGNHAGVLALKGKPQRTIGERLAARGVPCLNLTDCFTDADEEPLSDFAPGHPGVFGYRLLAERIAAALTERGLL